MLLYITQLTLVSFSKSLGQILTSNSQLMCTCMLLHWRAAAVPDQGWSVDTLETVRERVPWLSEPVLKRRREQGLIRADEFNFVHVFVHKCLNKELHVAPAYMCVSGPGWDLSPSGFMEPWPEPAGDLSVEADLYKTECLYALSVYSLVPHCSDQICTMGDQAFCSAAPRLWIALPDHKRAPQTTGSFKRIFLA